MSERLRRLAREHPDAFKRVAGYADGDLRDLLLDILDDAVGTDDDGAREESDERSAKHEWQLGDS